MKFILCTSSAIKRTLQKYHDSLRFFEGTYGNGCCSLEENQYFEHTPGCFINSKPVIFLTLVFVCQTEPRVCPVDLLSTDIYFYNKDSQELQIWLPLHAKNKTCIYMLPVLYDYFYPHTPKFLLHAIENAKNLQQNNLSKNKKKKKHKIEKKNSKE